MAEREPLSQAGDPAVSDLSGVSSLPSDSASDVSRDNIVSPIRHVAAAASRPAPEGVHFPGYLTCGITKLPPAQAVYFNIAYMTTAIHVVLEKCDGVIF